MTSAIAVDIALLIDKIERIEALRRLSDALTDVPYFFSVEEVEAMQQLPGEDVADSEDR